MQFLCECMKIDCEINCDARRRLRFCLGHQITQARHCMKLAAQDPQGNDDMSSQSPHQQLKFHFHQVSKQELDKLVASFILKEMLPSNMIESPTLIKILGSVCGIFL